MSRISPLSFAILGFASLQAAASELPQSGSLGSQQSRSTDAAPSQSATNASTKAPRNRDRPEKRDTCERQSELPAIHGRAGNDRLYGGGIAYQMFGDEDRDFLLGSSADDEINGGDDADLLIGGGGADLFVYDTEFASLPDKKGRWSPQQSDTIVDFQEEDRDKIDLTQMRKYGPNAPSVLQWSGTTPQAYSVWSMSRDGDTVVAADLDGDALVDFAIRLLGDVRLNHSNFCGVESNVS